MGRIGMPEIIIIAIVIMLLFGAKKLPEFAKYLAESLKIFKKTSQDVEQSVSSDESRDNTEENNG